MHLLLLLLSACNPDTTPPDSKSTQTGDADQDGFTTEDGDCNDGDATLNPLATEVCDGLDNNCDGVADEGTSSLFYSDADGDGYGDPATGNTACEAGTGQVGNALDCDDTDNSTYPGAPESCIDTVDHNCDGSVGRTDADGDGFAACEECDDGNADIHPGAAERCDAANRDEDCNGLTDDDDPGVDPTSLTTSYRDLDADGYGAEQILSCDEVGSAEAGDCNDSNADFYPGATESCTDPQDYNCDGSTGYADADGDRYAACEDCDDQHAEAHPGGQEICDGLDNDCDGQTDPAGALGGSLWYADTDADGYGDPLQAIDACNAPSGTVANDQDCDDTDAAVHPGAAEVCDGIDNDCDGQVDPVSSTDAATWYADTDGDTYGDPAAPIIACNAPSSTVANDQDCDDTDSIVHPGAAEVCDGIDNDCDGQVDPASSTDAATWYPDADGDGYGDPAASLQACTQPAAYLASATDCNDQNVAIHPGAGCDYVTTFYSPGSSSVYVASETGASVSFSDCGGNAAVAVSAGGVSAAQAVSTRTCTLRSADPFLSMITYSGAGGDQVMKARGLDGALLSTELVVWSGDYINVTNPSSSSSSFTVEQWSGSAWTAYSSGTAAAGRSSSVTAAWGVYRIRATQPVTAYGMLLDNIENYLEYLPATDGFLAGDDFLFSFPAELGQVGLSGTCIDAAGCTITLTTPSGTVATRSISQGASWYDYVSPATDYHLQSIGTVLLRHEATPAGFGASDGTTMDADLVPGTSGSEYDTSFLFTGAEGTGNSFGGRRSDVVILGYRDGTSLLVERYSGSAWSTVTNTTINAGTSSIVAGNLPAATLIRVTTSEAIQVELIHTSSEYAWSSYSDHYAD